MKNISILFTLTLLILIIVFTLNNCSKNSSPTQSSPISISSDTTFIGAWNWFKSIGGFSGGTITPSTEGLRHKLILRIDSTFELYTNDTLNSTTKYYIDREKLYPTSDSVFVIHYADSIRFKKQALFLISFDTLKLSDQCMDCYRNYYSRIK